jgi:hypothetical protein
VIQQHQQRTEGPDLVALRVTASLIEPPSPIGILCRESRLCPYRCHQPDGDAARSFGADPPRSGVGIPIREGRHALGSPRRARINSSRAKGFGKNFAETASTLREASGLGE